MKTSPAGRAAIEQREGKRLAAYRDSVGVWTIGVGHTGRMSPPAVAPGMRITDAQCDTLLAGDLAPVEAAITKALAVALTQNQFDALASLAFNIGVPRFAASSVVRRLNAHDIAGAADAFLLWVHPPELLARRKAERSQFLRPDAPAAKSTLEPTSKATANPAPPVPTPPSASGPPSAPAHSQPTANTENSMLQELAGVFKIVTSAIGLVTQYGSVVPNVIAGAVAAVPAGEQVAADIKELISDIEGGRYQETPEDIATIVGDFGKLVGAAGIELPGVAKAVTKTAALPSVAGLKAARAA